MVLNAAPLGGLHGHDVVGLEDLGELGQPLEVAKSNARAAGVLSRYETLAGSAFDADYGGPYDIVLPTNFLHHFDPQDCSRLLRKVNASLKRGGRAATLEFVPTGPHTVVMGHAT